MSDNVIPLHTMAPLRAATTLPKLYFAARTVGLEHVLNEPCAPLVREPDAGLEVTRLVETLMSHGARTIADLLMPGPLQGMAGNASRTARDRLIAIVRRRLEAALSGAAAKPKDNPPDPGSPPRTKDQLDRWSRAHGLGSLLGHGIGDVLDLSRIDRRLNYAIAHTSVRDVFFPDPSYERYLEMVVGRGKVGPLRQALWEALRKEADRIAALVELARLEEANPPPLPDDPRLRLVVERLRDERDRLRKHVGVLPPASGVKVALESSDDVFLQAEGGNLGASMAILLDRVESEPLRAKHLGSAHATDSCEHALLAVDAVLRALWMRPDPELPQTVALVLRTPGWSRHLSALTDVYARHEKRRQREVLETQLTWRLTAYGLTTVELKPLLHKRNKTGAWSAGTAVSVEELAETPALCPLPADRKAALHLSAVARRYDREGDVLRAVEMLAGHPRVFLDRTRERSLDVKIGQAGILVVPVKGGGFSLSPAVDGVAEEELLRYGFDSRRVTRLLFVDEEESVAKVVRLRAETLDLYSALRQRRPHFPPEAAGEILAFSSTIAARVPVTLPAALRGDELPHARLPVIRITPLDEIAVRVEVLMQPIAGGPAHAPGEGPRELHATADGRRVFVHRDFGMEAARARELISSLRLRADAEEPAFVFTLDAAEEALDLIAQLEAQPPDEVAVEWAGKRWRMTSSASPKQLRVEVARKRDWFGLQGTLDVDGMSVELAVVLDALRQKRRYVRVGPQQFVALGKELRERLRDVAAGTLGNDGALTMGPAAALALEAVATELGAVDADAGFRGFIDRVREAQQLNPAIPGGLDAVLRDYQKDGFRWLVRMAAWGAGCCLADDMGLGKTLQALALLAHRAKEGPALVVAPTSVCRNWVDEAARFVPALKIRLYRELDDKARDEALTSMSGGDVMVVSYGLLVRDAERLAKTAFATLVLDESQAVKNAATKRAQACRRLEAGFKIALTGTPLENHLGELWSLWRAVFPGLIGGWDEFRERFANPIERSGDVERRAALSALCRPFLLRRTKAQVAPELPPRTDMTELVELSAGERRLYEQARLAAVAQITGLETAADEKHRFEVLAALTRLRLCACHPKLYDENATGSASKLSRLVEILEELGQEGHRALVFSQFTSLLALVKEELDRRSTAYLYLDGKTPAHRRDELVKLFQAGQGGDVFLISLKAGGTGLNLTAATYVIHLDPWWNPAVEDQASDRAHRIGQERPVTVVRLVAQGTVEEQILSLHADKRALVAGVLEGTDHAARLSTDELIALIRSSVAVPSTEDGADDEEASAVVEVEAQPAPGAVMPKRQGRAAKANAAQVQGESAVAGPSSSPVRGRGKPGSEAPNAPVPDDAELPEWLGGTMGDLRRQAAEFASALRKEVEDGKLATDGPVRIYERCVLRFGDYMARAMRRGAASSGTPEESIAKYLEGLKAGTIAGPASEPIAAKTALRRFRTFQVASDELPGGLE